MTNLDHVTKVCGRCGAEGQPTKPAVSGGAEGLPAGWSTVQVSGLPTLTKLLCPPCVYVVRVVMTPPVVEVPA